MAQQVEAILGGHEGARGVHSQAVGWDQEPNCAGGGLPRLRGRTQTPWGPRARVGVYCTVVEGGVDRAEGEVHIRWVGGAEAQGHTHCWAWALGVWSLFSVEVERGSWCFSIVTQPWTRNESDFNGTGELAVRSI